jgi:hypothetical protein
MKHKLFNQARWVYLFLAVVLLMVSLVPMAVAQEPEEGEMEPAFAFHGAPRIEPNALILDALPAAVPAQSSGTSELIITDIEDVSAADLLVTYPPAFLAGRVAVSVLNVTPGDLLHDMAAGADYQFNWTDAGGTLTISIVLFGDAGPLQGNGSLARITWRAVDVIGGGAFPPHLPQNVTWAAGDFRDRHGNVIQPCTGLAGCPGDFVIPPTAGLLVEQFNQIIRAQVSPEGPGNPSPTTVTWTDSLAVTGGCVLNDAHFQCFPFGPPPIAIAANRPGYLGARADFVLVGEDLPNVTLIAGDVDPAGPPVGDGCINILDIRAIAGSLGIADPVMDFNNSGIVDIGDLALAAKNFGKCGTVNWRTGLALANNLA